MSLDGDDIPDFLDLWEEYVAEYGVIPKGETQNPINKSLQKEEKKMDKIKIYKTHIFVAVYAVLIIIELFFYVPYHSIQVFTSNQNVPHTEIIGSGYATMTDISYDKAYVKNIRSSKTGKRLDTSQLFMNVSITTIVAVAVYFLFLNEKNKEIKGMPILDVNSLAFCTDEEIYQAQQDYARKMAEFVKNNKIK